jgi:16S rRNA (guanine(966)-N(2))-methyltransferase RsmD
MKIVQGKYKGHRFGPGLDSMRPTSSFNREVLVNILRSNFPNSLDSTRVLDLFAGTGALAFEMLSAGARDAVLVEKSRKAVQMIRRNIEILGITEPIEVYNRAAENFSSEQVFDLVLLDPPYLYPADVLGNLLQRLRANYAPDALIVLESSTHAQATHAYILALDNFRLSKVSEKGDTRWSFLQIA